MQKFPDDWDLKTKIEFLQRKIILNSIAYYEYDTNFLSDRYYDSICRQLVAMHEEYGDISDTQYGYAFGGFDGSTGFDLYYRLTDEDREYLIRMVRWWIRCGGKEGYNVGRSHDKGKKSKNKQKAG